MALSELQARVARIFFALPESSGFALAGGSALLAQRLVDRTTKDLDLFGTERQIVSSAADALLKAAGGADTANRRRFVGCGG